MDQERRGAYEPVSTSDWLITILIAAIPLVGIIMLFVWAFGSDTHPSKANWAKATLIWFLIALVLGFLFSAIFGMAIFSGMENARYS